MPRTAVLASLSLLAATALPAVALAPADAKPAPQPKLTAKAVTVAESAGKVVVQLRLSAKATKTVKVAWATKNGTATAGTDYRAAHGTVTIKKGKKTGAITLKVLGDSVHESTETFSVRLSSKQARTTKSVAVTITDDDAAGPIAPSALTGTVTVTRSTPVPFASSTLTLHPHLVATGTPGEWRDDGTGTWSLTGTETDMFFLCIPPSSTTINATGMLLGTGDPGVGQATLVLGGFDPQTASGTPFLTWSGKASATRTTAVPTITPPICTTSESTIEYPFSLVAPGATGTYTGSTGPTRGVSFSYTGAPGVETINVIGTLTPVP